MKSSRAKALASIIALSLFPVLFAQHKSATAQSATFPTQRVTVPAQYCWFNTQFLITPGLEFRIYATGQWSNGGANPQIVGPTGFRNYRLDDMILASADFASLIAKVGPNGIPFAVIANSRSDTFLYSENYKYAENGATDHLYVSMNDIVNTCDDNTGHIDVNLTSKARGSRNPDILIR